MIPQDLLIKINDLLYEGTPEEPVEIDYDNPEWLQVQLEMCLNCHKRDQERLLTLRKKPYSLLNDSRMKALEDEIKDLERMIVKTSEEMVTLHGKKFNELLSGDAEIELIKVSRDYYKKSRK